MKNFIYIFILIVSSNLNGQVVFQSNFSNWTDSIPADWNGTKTSIEADSIVKMDTGGVYGTYACQLINNESSHKRINSDPVSVEESQSYKVSAWVRGKGDIRAGIYDFDVSDGDFGTYYASYQSINSQTWQQVDFTVTSDTTNPNAEFILSVKLTDPSGGHIQIDSVVVAKTTVSSTATAIFDIQYTVDVSGNSPMDGQLVTVTGIITASLAATGYFLQDNDSAWSGIYVYDKTNAPAQGDSISITGTVDEYNNLTEIKSVTSYTKHSSGNTIYTPISMTANNVNDEMYEGVLIRVAYAICDSVADKYGVWKIKDGSGTCYVDDDVIYKNTGNSFDPTLNKTYIVIGPVSYSYGKARILPRNTSTDISDVTGISLIDNFYNFEFYPNPSNDIINISFSKPVNKGLIKIFNLEGKLIYSESFSNTLTIHTDHLSSGTYIVEVFDGEMVIGRRKVGVN